MHSLALSAAGRLGRRAWGFWLRRSGRLGSSGVVHAGDWGAAGRHRPAHFVEDHRYGGGHRSFEDTAYDCSGSVSYALHGGGLLASPLPSTSFMRWGLPGRGAWITVYTNPGHAYAVIAGLRFDTSGPGQSGPRWRKAARISRFFKARHPLGL